MSKRVDIVNLPEAVFLCAIFIIGLLLRFVYIGELGVRSPYFEPFASGMDPLVYYNAAKVIAAGDFLYGKAVYFFMPLYAYFIALFYKLTSMHLVVARFFQSILEIGACIMLYFICRRLFNRIVGALACFIACFYSMFIFYDGILVPTSLSIFLSVLSLLLVLIISEKPSLIRIFFVGLIMGINCITTAGTIISMLLVGVWLGLIFRKNNKKKRLRGFIVFYAGVLIIVLLPTLRNYFLAGDFVPIAGHGGINFYIGNNEKADGKFFLPGTGGPKEVFEYSKNMAQGHLKRELKSSEISGFWVKRGLKFIVSHPIQYIKLMVKKVIIFFSAFEIPDVEDYYVSKKFSWILSFPLFNFGIIAPLALIGMIILRAKKHDKKIDLLYVFFFSMFFSCVLYFVNSRYRLAAGPYMIIFAAFAIWWFLDSLRRLRFKQMLLFFSPLILLTTLINIPHQQDFTISYYNLGTAYLKNDDISKAVKEFKKALFLRPNYAKAHLNLGICYYKQKRYDLALKEFNQSEALDPDNADVFYNLSVLYRALQNIPKAEENLEKALSFDPAHSATLAELADIYFMQNKYDKSKDAALKALETDAFNQNALMRLAEIATREEDAQTAKMYYEKVLKLDPKNYKVMRILKTMDNRL